MKKVIAVFLSLVMLAALAASAGADPVFLHPFTRVDDSALYLAGAPAGDGTITVGVNGQSFDNYTISAVQDAGLPITYYCIVDQSSSLSNSQKEQQYRALTALSDAMRPIDRMVLVLMGEELSFGEPLATAEERQQGIDQACVYPARFTNLNASIVSALETITAARDDESLGCILLITDGLDNARIAVSQEEVNQAIRSSGLSLCTLAVVDPWADKSAQKNANRMEEYANQSIGGFSVIPSRNDFGSATYVEDALNQVVDHVLSGAVLSLDLSQLPAGMDALEIEVTWQQGDIRVSDKCSVDGALIPAPTEPTQPETLPPETTQPETTQPLPPETTQPETTAPTETPPPVHSPSPGGNPRMLLILLVIGTGLLLFLIVLAVLLRYNRRSLEDQEPAPEHKPKKERRRGKAPASEEEDWEKLDISELTVQKNKPEPKPESGQQSKPELQNEPDRKSPGPQPRKEPPKRDTTPGCRVRLVPADHPEGAIEFFIGVNESVTLGRNKRSDITLNETDTALSGLHFELQWDSRVLHLRDRKSTNGTALNGVPLRPEVWVRVTGNAVIQAGSDRYTVTVEKK